MSIRRATLFDARAMAAVHVAAWQFAHRGVFSDEIANLFKVDERAEWFASTWQLERYVLVVTDESGNVVGFAADNRPANHGYDAEVASLYVHPDHSRRGYGRALIKAMAQFYIEDDRSTLCIQTLRDNKIGRSFYERLGGSVFTEDTWRTLPAVWYGWRDVRGIAEFLEQ